MFKKLLYFIICTFLSFSVYSDVIYFWIDEDGMALENQLTNVDLDSFKCFLTWNNNSKELDVELGKTVILDLGFWKIETETTVADLGHYDVDRNTIVYSVDTVNHKIDPYRGPEYSFYLELNMKDGSYYTGSFIEQSVTSHWMNEKHVCGGVRLEYHAAPEPSSFILIMIGLPLILLRRKC